MQPGAVVIDEPCKIFVAAYTQTHAIVVFAEPSVINEEIGYQGPMIADVMPGHFPPEDGLWMFEGVVRQHPHDDPVLANNGTTILVYSGEWRRPTETELAACAVGENPCLEPC